jgi:hypothetical protein
MDFPCLKRRTIFRANHRAGARTARRGMALLWPRHESHAAAHAWFAKSGRQAWATNPLTQLGVLRLLTNPAVTQGAVSAAAAVAVLSEATRHSGHEFWPQDRGLPGESGDINSGLTASWLWHAMDRDCELVTEAVIKEPIHTWSIRVHIHRGPADKSTAKWNGPETRTRSRGPGELPGRSRS